MVKNLFCLAVIIMLASDAPIAKAQQADANNYVLVFSDEFNLPNGSQPNPAKWNRHDRNTSTWSRWISNSPKVAYIKNGSLVCRAIPNKAEPTDTAAMLTGAINTKGKFSFQYGKVEVRMKTNLRKGNFPAVWLVPEDRSDPRYGEIDLVEMFNNQRKSHHTVHTHRTYTLNKTDLQNTFSADLDVRKWHVYGIEWTKDFIRWTVDDKNIGEYRRILSAQMEQEGQWTFDRPFYIIMNQSVGDELSQQSAPNIKKTYETRFDWIRVYQKSH